MRFRLGYLVPEFPGQTHVFFWREIQQLRALGIEVRLLSTRRPKPMICKHSFAKSAVAETHYLHPPKITTLTSWLARRGFKTFDAMHYISKIRAPQSLAEQFGIVAAAIDLVEWSIKNRIDHIHGHSCANSAHVIALANLLTRIPYSLTLHGDLEIYGDDHDLKMQNAKFVSAVGAHLVEQLVNKVRLPRSRVFSTLMGLDTGQLARRASSRDYQTKTLRVVTIARLNATKGHQYALEAIAKAKAAQLAISYTIVGEGPERAAIEQQIRALDLAKQVTMTGSLSEEEVFRELANADVFVLPSYGAGEAWPVSLMEAMAIGLPAIATKIGATKEMIINGENGFLVEQRDSEAIFTVMASLARDLDLRKRIGRAASLAAQNLFDVKSTAAKLLDAIQR